MNSKNSRTCKPHVSILNLTDKIDLRRGEKSIALINLNLSIYDTWNKIKNSYNKKFKISALTWNDKFELPNRSHYVSDIQHYFEYILKNMGKRLIIIQ